MLTPACLPARLRRCVTDTWNAALLINRGRQWVIDNLDFPWQAGSSAIVCTTLRLVVAAFAHAIVEGQIRFFAADRARLQVRQGRGQACDDSHVLALEGAHLRATHRCRFVARANASIEVTDEASGLLCDEAQAIIRPGARGKIIVRGDKVRVWDERSEAERREWPVVVRG